MTKTLRILLFFTLISTGLIAGLLFAFSIAINNGLQTLSDIEYIKTMTAINSAIQNPIFLACFLAPLLLYPLTWYPLYISKDNYFMAIVLAGAFYIIGVFGVTTMFNVPLNNQLASFVWQQAHSAQLQTMRENYSASWNFYHTLRTMAAIVAFALTLYCLLQKRNSAL